MPDRDVSAQEAKFVQEYMVDFDGARAAKAAGYTLGTKDSEGSTVYRLLHRPRVRELLRERARLAAPSTVATAAEVLAEIRRLAMSDVGEAFDSEGRLKPLQDMDPDIRRAISSIDVEEDYLPGSKFVSTGRVVKVKFWDKGRSLEMLAKYLQLWVEKSEVKATLDVRAKALESLDADTLKKLAEGE